ncbi:vesicle-mediated transport, partial [Perkinsus olseni]
VVDAKILSSEEATSSLIDLVVRPGVEYDMLGSGMPLNLYEVGVDGVLVAEHDRKTVKAAATVAEDGPYWICIGLSRNAMRVPTDVLLDLRYGGDAADFTQLANKDHLDATQVELHRIQVILKEYHKTLFYMRERDERMRQTTESTSTRLVMFSLMNAGIVIAAAGLQILYYRRYFTRKKMI